jgi:hypothetical protein
MLEAEVPNVPSGPFEDDLDDGEKKELIQCFLDAVSPSVQTSETI